MLTHFANENFLGQLAVGQVPRVVAAHEAVASHYGVGSVFLCRELAERIDGASQCTPGQTPAVSACTRPW
eukprot:SAG22_NODE_8728_length_634_cov_1.353271_2_plen_70_part_00